MVVTTTHDNNADWQLPEQIAFIAGDWECEKCRGAKCSVCGDGRVPVKAMRAVDCTPEQLQRNIADIEGLVVNVVDAYTRNNDHLSRNQRQDLISDLLAVAWKESLKYKYVGGTGSLLGYMSWILNLRIVDWYRREFGNEAPRKRELLADGVSPEDANTIILDERKQRIPVSLDVESEFSNRVAYYTAAERLFDDEQAEIEFDLDDDLELFMPDEDVIEIQEAIDAREWFESSEDTYEIGLDVDLLSEDARNTLMNIAVPLAQNQSRQAISAATHMSSKQINAALERLAAECEEQGINPWG